MKNKTNLSITFLSILCFFAIANAEIGFGISDVGTISSITGIEDETMMPIKYSLNQNYPNPFNPSTKIKFQIPPNGVLRTNSEFTTLKVYNILGKEVSTLVAKKLNPGNYTYTFDGKNLASGVYYYQLLAGNYHVVRKMILLK